MLKGPVVLLGVPVVGLVIGLSVIPSLLGLGNVADTACDVCDHRSAAFTTSGVVLPIAASSIAGLLLGSLLFWKPERGVQDRKTAVPGRFCTNCGRGNQPEWNLCPFCGQSVRPVRQESGEAQREE